MFMVRTLVTISKCFHLLVALKQQVEGDYPRTMLHLLSCLYPMYFSLQKVSSQRQAHVAPKSDISV
jgi:hypothetical protein